MTFMPNRSYIFDSETSCAGCNATTDILSTVNIPLMVRLIIVFCGVVNGRFANNCFVVNRLANFGKVFFCLPAPFLLKSD